MVCQRIAADYFAARRRTTATMPPTIAERRQDHHRQPEHRLGLLRGEEDRRLLRVLGPDRRSGPPARRASDTVLRKKSRLPWTLRNWLAARFGGAVHDDPRLVLGGDRGQRERPLGVLGIGLGLAPLEGLRGPSRPSESGVVLASGCTVTPAGGVLAVSTLRVSGNSVVMPAMSRVIGCDSYCCTIGTWGPMPNSRPIGFSSITRSSPSVEAVLAEQLPQRLRLVPLGERRVDHGQQLAAAAEVGVERVDLRAEEIGAGPGDDHDGGVVRHLALPGQRQRLDLVVGLARARPWPR